MERTFAKISGTDAVGWRAYGQKDPLTNYKQEAYHFGIMLTRIRHRVVYFVLRSRIIIDEKLKN